MQTLEQIAWQTAAAMVVVDRLLDRLVTHTLTNIGIDTLSEFDSDRHRRAFCFKATDHMTSQLWTPCADSTHHCLRPVEPHPQKRSRHRFNSPQVASNICSC